MPEWPPSERLVAEPEKEMSQPGRMREEAIDRKVDSRLTRFSAQAMHAVEETEFTGSGSSGRRSGLVGPNSRSFSLNGPPSVPTGQHNGDVVSLVRVTGSGTVQRAVCGTLAPSN